MIPVVGRRGEPQVGSRYEQLHKWAANVGFTILKSIAPNAGIRVKRWVFPDGSTVECMENLNGLAPIRRVNVWVPPSLPEVSEPTWGLYLDSGYITLPHISWFFSEEESPINDFFPLPIYKTQAVKEEISSLPYENTALLSARSATIKDNLIVSSKNSDDLINYEYYFEEWPGGVPNKHSAPEKYQQFLEAYAKIKTRIMRFLDTLGGVMYPALVMPPAPPHRWTGLARLVAQALYTSHARYVTLESLISHVDPTSPPNPDNDGILVDDDYNFYLARMRTKHVVVFPLKVRKPAAAKPGLSPTLRNKVIAYMATALDKLEVGEPYTIPLGSFEGWVASYGWHYSYTGSMECARVGLRWEHDYFGFYGSYGNYASSLQRVVFNISEGVVTATANIGQWKRMHISRYNFWIFPPYQPDRLRHDYVWAGWGTDIPFTHGKVPVYCFYSYNGELLTLDVEHNIDGNPKVSIGGPAFGVYSTGGDISGKKFIQKDWSKSSTTPVGGLSINSVSVVTEKDYDGYWSKKTWEWWADDAGESAGYWCGPGWYANAPDFLMPLHSSNYIAYLEYTWLFGGNYTWQQAAMLVLDNPDAVTLACRAVEVTQSYYHEVRQQSPRYWKWTVGEEGGPLLLDEEGNPINNNPCSDFYSIPDHYRGMYRDSYWVGFNSSSYSNVIIDSESADWRTDYPVWKIGTVSAAGANNGNQLRTCEGSKFSSEPFFRGKSIVSEENIETPVFRAIDSAQGVSWHLDEGVNATESLANFIPIRSRFIGWA
jgi:hypothetical protein